MSLPSIPVWVKAWAGALVTVAGILAGLGYAIDRPYWKSEADRLVNRVDELGAQVSANTLDALNRAIWQLEARPKLTGQEQQILKQLKEQRRRLIEKMQRNNRKG